MRIGEIKSSYYTQSNKISNNNNKKLNVKISGDIDEKDTSKTQIFSTDKFVLSAKENELMQEEVQKKKEKDAKEKNDELQNQLDSSNMMCKAMSDSAETQSKCLTIAMRIMSGNIVPKADQQYLAKNNSELYGRALTMRIAKEKPKKYKQLTEDEENNNNIADIKYLDNTEIELPENEETPPSDTATPSESITR